MSEITAEDAPAQYDHGEAYAWADGYLAGQRALIARVSREMTMASAADFLDGSTSYAATEAWGRVQDVVLRIAKQVSES